MTDKIVILVTCGSRKESRKIAKHLVENRLAACVNIAGPIDSLYRWKGKVATDKEFQLFMKSTRDLFPEIKAAIVRLHSYQTPEIICLPIIDGAQNYLNWIGDSVRKAASAPTQA